MFTMELLLIPSASWWQSTLRLFVSLLLMLAATARTFEPFAGVAELSPQRLAGFCREDGGRIHGSGRGVRRCTRSTHKRLEDGGEIRFDWQLDVDPHRILSLDTEGDVRVTRCDTNELELEIPKKGTAAMRASMLPVQQGDCVVASRWTHNCPHLQGKNLYHCVLAVEVVSSRSKPGSNADDATDLGDVTRFRLLTMEVPSLAHLADAVDFSFSYVPPESKEVVRFPRQRTSGAAGRGQNASGSHRLRPNSVANLGWNWDFERNATEAPKVSYAVPGASGRVILHHPYAKAHVGISFNFSSRFSSDDLVPRIKFELGMDGHATINARLISELEEDHADAEDANVYRHSNIPILKQFEDIRWLGPLDFFIGSIPVSFEPGFQFSSMAHLVGNFRGSLQMGINAHAKLRPRLRYNSQNGVEADCFAELRDVRLSPPMWMISTRHFEMGMQLEPQLWIRGQLGGVENIKAGLALLPFANVTIRREVGRNASTHHRHLWSAADWEARWAKLHAHCRKDQVHFGLGAGLLVRGELEHMKLPSVFPQIGWLQTEPDRAAHFGVAGGSYGDRAHFHGTLEDVLPQACAGGLCEGTLPACAKEESRFFERITWHFNRPFRWGSSASTFAEKLRSDVAHTFSTLPAAVDVELPGSADNLQLPARLGRRVQGDQHLELSSLVTYFKEGLPYVADRPLIEMLLRHGSLDDFHDGLQHEQGPLYITGFSLQREQPSEKSTWISSWFGQISLFCLVFCACGCMVAAPRSMLYNKRRRPAASAVYSWLQGSGSGPESREESPESNESFPVGAE